MDRPCINCQQYFDIREHYGICPNCNFDKFNQSTYTNNVSNKTEKINMKNFKDNQKVRHPKYGEGIFNNFEKFPNTYTIAFEEFSTQVMQIGNDFYNQLEQVEDLPEVGEYAYFWDDLMIEKKAYIMGKLGEIDKSDKYPYYCIGAASYQYISKTPPKFD